MPADERKRAHVRIRGRVQGVFFRGELRERARSRHAAGWVRNNPDGTVEAVLEGPADAVESIVEWCGRGPSGAEVEDVEVIWETPDDEQSFSVR